MHSVRNRLLLMALLIVVTAAAWSPAHARGVKSNVTSGSEWTTVEKQPIVGPTSGEPDVGQGPKPSKSSSCVPSTQPPSVKHDLNLAWLQWALRIWMSTTFGAR
jgi:hypothetical protein